MFRIEVTDDVSQEFSGWLKLLALKKAPDIEVTVDVSQECSGWLKLVAL